MDFDSQKIQYIAKKMRRNAIEIGFRAGNKNAHFAPGLSIIEIMAVLYGSIMNYDTQNAQWIDRDRFILSKGHGTLGYYTALEAVGIISKEQLFTFEENDGNLPGQPAKNPQWGIEVSSGSLGHGLGLGIGIALAGEKKNLDYKTYVLMGDGECNEGTVWESAAAASCFNLDHLIAIVDRNNMQSDGKCETVLDMEPFVQKWEAFGWNVISTDGHDISSLYKAFTTEFENSKPKIIIADTIKGKGISFMENNPEWHNNHLTEDLYLQAIAELEDV